MDRSKSVDQNDIFYMTVQNLKTKVVWLDLILEHKRKHWFVRYMEVQEKLTVRANTSMTRGLAQRDVLSSSVLTRLAMILRRTRGSMSST